jgi:uncharacterized protein with HEPN domain
MPHRDDTVSLRQMLDHAREARELVEGRSREDLDRDRVLSLALMQLLQILGEAASRVSEGRRNAHPGIPWSGIVGLRNRLIHGYDTIDLDILWQILTSDLPDLIPKLETILGQEDA